MKKLICVSLALIMVLLACPLTMLAADGDTTETIAGPQNDSNKPISVYYYKDGVKTYLGHYDSTNAVSGSGSIDAAMEAIRYLYVGPLTGTNADGSAATKVTEDTNGNGTMNDELYAAAGSPVIVINYDHNPGYSRCNWASNSNISVASNYDGTASDTNITYTNIAYDAQRVVTFVIDGSDGNGGNRKLTYTAAGIWNYLGWYNVEFKNIDFVIDRGNSETDNVFCWQAANATSKIGENYTTFENCVIDENSTLVGSDKGALFKLNGMKKVGASTNASSNIYTVADDKANGYNTDIFNLTFKDTKINSSSSLGLQVHWGADANVNLVNTTWTLDGTAGAGENDAILKCYDAGNVNFNIDGTSKLISARSEGSARSTLIQINSTSYYPVKVTLEKGAQLILDDKASLTYGADYINNKAGTMLTITDKGAVYTASANDVKVGVALFAMEGMVWLADDVAVGGHTYTKADATAAVTFTYVDEASIGEHAANVAYIQTADGSKQYCDSLQAAFDALATYYEGKTGTDEALWQAAGSPIIYIYKDITLTAQTYPSWWNTSYNAASVKTVYVKSAKADGTNALITSTFAGGVIRYNAYYNLTLENIDMDCNGGFALFWSGYSGGKNSGKSTTNMINCNISAPGTSGEGLVFKVTGNQNQTKTENYIINMVNTNVVAEDGVNAVFLFHHGCAGELNIDGKSSVYHTMNKNSSGGDTMFMLGTQREFTINVADGAELTANYVSGYGGWSNYAMFRTENSNTYASASGIKQTINIADGAKLTINADAAQNNFVMFIDTLTPVSMAETVINIGETAKFSLNKDAADNRFYLVGNSTIRRYAATDTKRVHGEGYNNPVIGYKKADGTVKLGESFVVSEDIVEVNVVTLDLLVKGASLRTDNTSGIRFSTDADADYAEILANAVSYEFGTILSPTKFNSTLTLTNATVAAEATNETQIISLATTKWQTTDGLTRYHAALINVPEAGYTTDIDACAYITITYLNHKGAEETFTWYTETVTRSMYEIAQDASYADNTFAQYVIATVEAAA